MSAQPAIGVSVTAGSPAAYTVSVTPTSGSPGAVTVTVTAPVGTTASVSPADAPGRNGHEQRSRSRRPGARRPGTYPVTINGLADGVRHSTTLSLTVLAAPPPTRLRACRPFGNANPPGLTGTADDADIILVGRLGIQAHHGTPRPVPWSLPSGAKRRRPLHGWTPLRFYVSFAGDVAGLNGLGTVPGRGHPAVRRQPAGRPGSTERRAD